ncbi:M56 family metallopeptidase [Pseudoclostridium thermosuccinogenes]|uniref:M56 family metallopeptidase n=1 Tax=Clostridium thermosuccinogenes TaxID=84032 RepID=UPI002FDAE970
MDIIQTSVSASVLIVAVVIIRTLALYKLPKKTFIVLWGVVLFRLLVPVSIPSRFSLYTGLDMLKGLLAEDFYFTPTMKTAGISNMADAPVTEVTVDAANAIFPSPVKIVWFIGMSAFALFFTIVYVKCVRQFNMSLPVKNEFITLWMQEKSLLRPVQIRQNDRIKTPLTYGVFRPVILLPKNTDWKDEMKLRYILAHEFTHIRHFDTLLKLIITIAVCVHWFNPLVWVMYIVANRDIELSCDETVVRSQGETMKSSYALMLLELEKEKAYSPFANHFSKSAIEERMVSIMKMKKMSIMAIVLAVLLVAATSTVFATDALTTTDTSSGENVKYAEKITDYDDKDAAFTADSSATPFSSHKGTDVYDLMNFDGKDADFIADSYGTSFSSHKGTPADEQKHAVDFDLEKAIADIKSGAVKPLSKDNLPDGISKDDVIKFTDQNGKKSDVNLNGFSIHVNCAHVYTPGILVVNAKASDGSCTYTTFDAIRCHKCNTIWVLDLISTTTYRVCPH